MLALTKVPSGNLASTGRRVSVIASSMRLVTRGVGEGTGCVVSSDVHWCCRLLLGYLRAWLILGPTGVRRVSDSLATVLGHCEGDVEGWLLSSLLKLIDVIRLSYPVLVTSFLLGSRL